MRFLTTVRPVLRSRATLLSRASSSHSSAETHSSQYETEEGFNSPIWRNAALFSLALVLYYRLSPTPALKADEEAPVSFITNYLAFHRPEENLFKARNAKHLDLAKAAADDKLLFQEAERPKVRRMRYPGSFEQASPNAIVVGSQTDLSDLRIKSEKEDFAIEE